MIEDASAAAFLVAAMALAWYLLAPTWRRAPVEAGDARAALEAARAVALRALQDLELDWATGKLSDADYHAQRATLEDAAARAARHLDGGGA
ncbi:MAG: hypothetical protein QN203_04540 [Armatimonadota bacterium]|nr:hypothetical protein [Armatimonadota bacterium]